MSIGRIMYSKMPTKPLGCQDINSLNLLVHFEFPVPEFPVTLSKCMANIPYGVLKHETAWSPLYITLLHFEITFH